MRSGYLIPAVSAAFLALAACGGAEPAPATPAGHAVPVPTLAELSAPYNAADLGNGAKLFYKCRSCHQIETAKGHMVGPNLHGVFERKPGAAPNYKYSPALTAFDQPKWTPELIDHWLQQPQGFLPGTSMFFNGFSKPEDRRDVIAYLLIETRK